MLPRPRLALLASLFASACAADGPAGAPNDAAVFVCEPPLAIEMTASTAPSNAGLLTAGIGWTDGRCELYGDETHPDVFLVVADFEGAFGLGLVAAGANDWVIESSDLTSSPTTYITGFSYSELVSMVLEKDGVRLALTLRVFPGTLTVVELRLV